VAALRGEAGRNPYDGGLTDLVGELSTRSSTFRTLCPAHDVRHHRTGTRRIHHPVVRAYEELHDLIVEGQLNRGRGWCRSSWPSASGCRGRRCARRSTAWCTRGWPAGLPARVSSCGEGYGEALSGDEALTESR
jgi:hypothetical protein